MMTIVIASVAISLIGLWVALPLLQMRKAPARMRARGSAPVRDDESLARKVAIVAALREAVQRRGLMQVRMPDKGEEEGTFELERGGRGSFRIIRESRRGVDYVVELEALAQPVPAMAGSKAASSQEKRAA